MLSRRFTSRIVVTPSEHKVGRWLCLLFLVPFFGLGAPDYNKFEHLARERYDDRAAEVAAEFTSLMRELRSEDVRIQLERVNGFFNRHIRFTDDSRIWGESDYWASPLETIGRGAGDCEDFTIAKYTALRLLGVPVSKLRLTYVNAKIGGAGSGLSQAHMVLTYYESPRDTPLVLDNLVGDIRPADQRPDLVPVFGFNSDGLWVGNQTTGHDPKARLSRWRDVLLKIQNEGLN